MQERKATEEPDNDTLSQDSENYDPSFLESLKPKPQDQDLEEANKFFEIKWKAFRNLDKNEDDDEQFDYLSESIKNSKIVINGDLSICDDRDEINTIYTQLD